MLDRPDVASSGMNPLYHYEMYGKNESVQIFTLDDDIKIIEGPERLFIAMPSRRTPDNEYKDIAHPINIETRELLQNSILEKYHSTLIEENY